MGHHWYKAATLSKTWNWGKTYTIQDSDNISNIDTKQQEYNGVHVAQSLVFWVVFCMSLFVLFLLAIVFSVPRFTVSDFPLWYLQTFLPNTKRVQYKSGNWGNIDTNSNNINQKMQDKTNKKKKVNNTITKP